MNRQTLNELLDSVYELEGLIHLALSRDDVTQHLLQLISGKGKSVAFAASKIGSDSPVDKEPDLYLAEEEDILHIEENPGEESPAEDKEDKEEEEAPVILAPLGVPAEVPELPAEGTSPEEEATVMAAVDAPVQMIETPDLMEKVVDELAGAEEMAMEEIVEDIAKESLTTHPETSEAAAMVAEPEVLTVAPALPKVEPKGRLVFTLNDKFRFKRELFGNSDAAFNDTLAYVASLDNYLEAEDYFLTELQWNPEREEVKEFLEILKKYFR